MTDHTKNMHETIASHFGLGSSTCGMTMDEANRGRSEAEARAERAAKPRVRCKQGESFEAFERRMFKRCRDGFDAAIRDAEVAMEDANFPPEIIQDFKNIVADFCGDTWNVDPRAED